MNPLSVPLHVAPLTHTHTHTHTHTSGELAAVVGEEFQGKRSSLLQFTSNRLVQVAEEQESASVHMHVFLRLDVEAGWLLGFNLWEKKHCIEHTSFIQVCQ